MANSGVAKDTETSEQSAAPFEYHYWGLEESEFKGMLYNTIGCFYLYDHPYQTWDEFEKALPHMAYTHLVSGRFHLLEQQFVDLRVIVQMLSVSEVPIKSSVMNINRYEWLKSALDLKLLRFSSIRDLSLHFVNEVLELRIPPRQLSLKSLRKRIQTTHPLVISELEEINRIGSEIREERNARAHQGAADLLTDDDTMFKNISWAETYGSYAMNYDLKGIYEESSKKLYDRLVAETDRLQNATIALVDGLIEEFETHYHTKWQPIRKKRGSKRRVGTADDLK